MSQPFRVIIKDVEKHRIVIPKEIWDEERIEKGDIVEVIVKKLKVKGED